MLASMTGPEFEIIRTVGAGATAEVVLGKELATGRLMALKQFSPALLQDPAMLERLALEAEMLSRIRHPNIVQVHGQILQKNVCSGLKLEFVDGVDLATLRKSLSATIPLEPIYWILVQILRGLGAAHAANILHRDLKPENVLLSTDGEVKVSDFGLARCLDRRTITRSGVFLGSLGYMAPEVIEGERGSHRSDIFSFGVLAYELLGGESPFPGKTPQALIRSIAEGKVNSMGEKAPHLPPSLRASIESCLSVDPSGRPATVWHLEAEFMAHIMESGLVALCPSLVASLVQQAAPGSPGRGDGQLWTQALEIKRTRLQEVVMGTAVMDRAEAWMWMNEIARLFPDAPDLLEAARGRLQALNEAPPKRATHWALSLGAAALMVATLLWSQSVHREPTVVWMKAPTAAPVAESARGPSSMVGAAERVSVPVPAAAPVVPLGYIRFDVDSDVSVFVDGKAVHRRRMKKYPVPVGTRQLRLVKEGFDPIENRVDVKADQVSVVRVRSQ